MNKTYELKNWWFSKEENKKESWYTVHGNCFKNPKYMRGHYIHISKITKIETTSEGLLICSKEGEFLCKYEYSMEQTYDFITWKELFENYDLNELNSIQGIIEQTKEKRKASEQMRATLDDEPNCLILTFSDESLFYNKKAILKSRGEEYELPIVEVEADVCDYVLIGHEASMKDMPKTHEKLDLRYFPSCSGWMRFYYWNGYTGKVFARNTGNRLLKINTPFGKFELKPNDGFYEISPESIRGRIVK